MITTEERSRMAVGVGATTGMEPPSTGRRAILKNLKLGFALMWDRRVPAHAKLMAWGLAIGITAIVLAIELPIEALMAALFSHSGYIGDFILDWVEAIAGPIILSCLLLPFEGPSTGDNQIRRSVPEPRQRQDMKTPDYLERMRKFNQNNPKVLKEQGNVSGTMGSIRPLETARHSPW